jgi:protease-4
MTLEADYWIDRRRLKRHLTFWRVLAVVAVIAALLAALGRFDVLAVRGYVARLSVEGIILDDRERDKTLRDIAKDDRVKALIVHVDSPGGTVVGGEALYRNLRMVGERKPVVAVLGELGTSAAYMTALGSDFIVAREGTITGSIGVVLQTTDFTGLLERVGIKPEAIKSTPLKAQPSPLEPLTPAAREAIRGVVLDMYEMFVGMVGERRGLSREATLALADGRVFTGRQATANRLVDAIGGEAQAREWLAENRGIQKELPVRDVEIDDPQRQIRDLVGTLLGKSFFSERLRLDGLVSLWHPEQ